MSHRRSPHGRIPLWDTFSLQHLRQNVFLKLLDGLVRIDRKAALQADEAGEAGIFDGAQNVDVVHFARARLFASRVIGDMVVVDAVDVAGCVTDDVAFRNLLVVDVEHELDVRAAN